MPLHSSEIRPLPPTLRPRDDGPVLEGATLADPADAMLRIRARRLYAAPHHDVFAAWTRRTAWDSWMRMRARSRTSLAAYCGGGFRVELAEGPAIHVITGTVMDVRANELLSLSWVHHGKSDQPSFVDVSIRDLHGLTELTLVHHHIASRREAAWLMRLWSTVLDRLATYLDVGAISSPKRLADTPATRASSTEPEARRSDLRRAFARSAGIAVTVMTSAFAALGSAHAQLAASGPSVPADSAQAAAHYSAGRWTQSAEAYRALLRADTTNTFNWYRYGVSLEEIGQYKESISALRHALRAQPPLSNQVRYRLAKAHAGLGLGDSAIVHLDAAAGGGLRTWEAVKADADFAPLHGNARFTQALAHIENNRFPCRQAAESRQLDFWVGDWTVVTGSTVLGTNRIERVNGDCMLQENWQSNGGGGGKSWSYYDPTLLKWKQLFIFDNGGVMDFTGGLHDGTMRFESPAPATANSTAAITRMTFFPIAKDTVRQLFQRSTDGGKTWSAGFDGLYVRKPGTTP